MSDGRSPSLWVGVALILIGLLFLSAGFGISLKPLSVVTYRGGGIEVEIAGIPLPVATALWIGATLIVIGVLLVWRSER